MNPNNLELSELLLRSELVDWLNTWSTGRDDRDLRFGQYIWSKYDMSKLFPIPDAGIDGFSTESPSHAYNQIIHKINKHE